MANRLGSETSPYLLQHAHNPVDWYPWGDEALALAREQNRPILLSVGYSACHWCHVMERESFEDPGVAELMNAAFINIKVDREERPDVDQIYMKAVQAMTGSGGWPLTVFLTPTQEPFYGGTYFPPEARHGLPSFRQVLRAAADAYTDRFEDVQKASTELMQVLRSQPVEQEVSSTPPGLQVIDNAVAVLSRQYDRVHGGFGRAPKFPQPVTLELLLRQHLRTGQPEPLEMCVHTLRRMAAGGLRDHLGGGFHRYSVDAEWLVPHFEKMLYDNALLASVYTDAYRVTGAEDLRGVAEHTLDYLLADLRSPDGGFFTARDADSEGEEGMFYVWRPAEVEEVLGPQAAQIFNRAYDVSPAGNFEGRSILRVVHPFGAIARAEGVDEEVLSASLAEARALLLSKRSERVPPLRDEKILTSWNGLAIRAFAEAGRVFGRADYLDAAVAAAEFLLAEVRVDDRLRHTFKDGVAKVDGFLEDYGAVGNALISLYGATLDPTWLEDIRWCCDAVLERFWEESEDRLYDSPADGETLVLRPRDPMDNATPSGTSLAGEMLARAGHLLDRPEYIDVADRVLASEAEALRRYPPAFGRLLSVLDRRLAAPWEVAVVGHPEALGTQDLLAAAWAPMHRNLTVAGGHPDDPGFSDTPLLRGRNLVDGKPAAYVCRGYACQAPVISPHEVTRELSAAQDDGPERTPLRHSP